MIARGKALKKEGAPIERGMRIAPGIATFDLNEHLPDSGGGQDRASDRLEQRQIVVAAQANGNQSGG
jgi:hypothetical protein